MGIKPITQADVDAFLDQQKTENANITKKLTPTAKALAMTIFSEINLLRVQAGLPPRTMTEFKQAVKSNL